MSNWELRCSDELRATDEGRLEGYAVVWNSRSQLINGAFIEVIEPGAFTRSLNDPAFRDVLALVGHDPNKPLARVSSGTLQIREDDHGLHVSMLPAQTSYARDLVELVRSGVVRGMSFGFRPYPGGSKLDVRQTPPLHTVREAQLKEVSIVVRPAYPATEINVRALTEPDITTAMQRMKRRLRLAANQ